MASSSTLPWLKASAPTAPTPATPAPQGNSLFPTVQPSTGLAGTFSTKPTPTAVPSPVAYQPLGSSAVQASPTYAPVSLPPVNTQNNFSLNTSNATSDHMVGDYTPATVSSYRDQLQNNFNAYHAAQMPLQNLYSSTVGFSPDEITARQNVLDLSNGLASGLEAMRGQGLGTPLSIVRGNQEKLQNQTALRQTAASNTLSNLEAIRQNNLQAIQSQIGFNQQNYQDQTGVVTNSAQLGIAQQTANQGRYDYQQIMDPNTGFPVIQVIDKQSGLPVGNISPSSSAGQTILQGMGAQNTAQAGTATNGNAIVQSTMQMMGASQDMPVSQAIGTLGIQNIVSGLIGQEGGSPQGVVNNPGNIKIPASGVPMAGQIPSGVKATDGGQFASYATPQAGVAAVANLVNNAAQSGSNLSDFIAGYKGVTNTQPQPKNTYDAQVQALVQAAPIQIKNGIKQLPDGTPYIDGSQIQSQFLPIANSYSAKTGIRVLSATDATAIDSAKQAITNMQAYAATFSQLAPNNFGGKLGNAIANPFSKTFGTDYGSQLKAFQQNRDGLLQQIRTLAGSSPRLNANELNLAASALPQLGGLTSDTAQDGANKLTLTGQYLDNAIRALDPNYIGTPIAIGNQYAVRLSDGVTHYYPNKDNAMNALQLNRK